MRESIITGERVLLPDGSIRPAAIRIAEGRIAAVEPDGRGKGAIEAGELLVAPAIVDVHGDAFERQIHPRPGVGVDVAIALAETDRQMIANGIATAFHGLTVSWEPGSRDLAAAHAFLEGLAAVRPRLRCDTRLHLRHEVLSLDTVDIAGQWIAEGLVDLLAINDHSYMVENALARPQLLAARVEKLPIGESEYRALAAEMLARRLEIPASVERLTRAARARGIALASHDDNSPEDRRYYRGLGCTISEFPGNRETAEEAVAAGDAIVMGAPNVLRGGSHCGRVTVADIARLGLCTAICSDYYYPAILYAPFRLAQLGVASLAACWDLVSRGPARAAGLRDRGCIEPGLRADLLFIDDSDPLHPQVQAAFVRGELVYRGARTAAPQAALALV